MRGRRGLIAICVLASVAALVAVASIAGSPAGQNAAQAPGVAPVGHAPAVPIPPGSISADTCNWDPFTYIGCIINVGNTISSWYNSIQSGISDLFGCLVNPGGCIESAALALIGDVFLVVEAAAGALIMGIADALDGMIYDVESAAIFVGVWGVPIFTIGLVGIAVTARFALEAVWDAWSAGGWL